MSFSLTFEDDNAKVLESLIVLADVLRRYDVNDNVIDFGDPAVPAALLAVLTNLNNSIWHQCVGVERLAKDETLQALWLDVQKAHYSLQQGINRRTGKAVGP